MTCHAYDADIGDYVDGTLPSDRAAALEVHLGSCARCSALAADFKTLRSATAGLERRNAPPHVWTRVAAELDAHGHHRRGRLAWAAPGISWWPGFAWRSAVAASILVAILAGGAWLSWREASDLGSLARRSEGNLPSASGGADSAQDHVQRAVQVMRTDLSNMEGIVKADSAVRPVYEASGALIDDAIGRTSAALEIEPSNVLAQQSLFEALRSKLALLQEMIALINEMRKGNQEGAARIVSGMDQ